MRGIDAKSVATLIDELITTSMKCWHAQDGIASSDEKKALDSARSAQALNARRNALIRAIDARFGESDISPTGKTY